MKFEAKVEVHIILYYIIKYKYKYKYFIFIFICKHIHEFDSYFFTQNRCKWYIWIVKYQEIHSCYLYDGIWCFLLRIGL